MKSPDTAPMQTMLENVTFDKLKIGSQATLTRTLSQKDIGLFAIVSRDVNPVHMDPAYAQNDLFHGVTAHGMWSSALISTVLGTLLPGPGTIYLEQAIKFLKPVRTGDKLTVTVTVTKKSPDKPIATFDCVCINQKGETVLNGVATVLVPTTKIRIPRPELPEVAIQTHDYYRQVITDSQKLPLIRVAIVHPVSPEIIKAVAEAVAEKLMVPVLIGPRVRIEAAAREAQVDIINWDLIAVEHSHAAAAKAVELAGSERVDAIMKGALHTDELLGAILSPTSKLRTERRMSHAFVMAVPTYFKPLIITDAAINIATDVNTKADICQNAINLWRMLFNENGQPKVALLAAVETVNPKMQATMDAAALCKMSERGQITNGILDGPLAFDNAISSEAAKEKGIVSPVAGDADILLVPEIESGNMLAKQLSFLGKADAAGIVLGARVPIILSSRADSLRARLMSCALAVKMAWARREGKIK